MIERAKATNMAKDKIESAIKSGVKVDFVNYLKLYNVVSVGKNILGYKRNSRRLGEGSSPGLYYCLSGPAVYNISI